MRNNAKKSRFVLVITFLVMSLLGFVPGAAADNTTPDSHVMPGAGNCQTFSETGFWVCGRFLDYWTQNGGLAQQGYPISEPELMTSPTNGKTYTTQKFERAWFEYHPENQAPYDVLLTQLGRLYQGPQAVAPNSPEASCKCNAETDTMPINADDNITVTLAKGWWDVEDTTCGGPGTGENKCHEFYPIYSDGTMVLPPYSADNGHRRAWRVHGERAEANCTVLTEATQYAKEHPDYHVAIRQELTDH